MNPIDQRGKLQEDPFDYQITKERSVFISWHGKRVTILKGQAAEKFIAAIEHADAQSAQLLMARATGHFKHGNEQ
ncbi:MAG TPA: hypothetical protein VFF78_01355 [Anaerolineaceae bacterium]|nr:hypothetical protein [Anaerolineaceae bacterium]